LLNFDRSICITGPPSKPQGPLTAIEVQNTSAIIEWKPPMDDGGLELKGYVVEYTLVYKDEWIKVT